MIVWITLGSILDESETSHINQTSQAEPKARRDESWRALHGGRALHGHSARTADRLVMPGTEVYRCTRAWGPGYPVPVTVPWSRVPDLVSTLSRLGHVPRLTRLDSVSTPSVLLDYLLVIWEP